MIRCILCGKTVDELGAENPLTEEHIIPHALGNDTLKEYFLCKCCNSNLGNKVDAPFVDSFIMKMIRKVYNIRCTGTIPNPFKEGKDDNGNLIRVDDNMVPHIIPRVEKDGNHYAIHTSTKEEAKSIIKKVLQRNNISQEEITKAVTKVDEKISKKYNPTIQYPFEINLRTIKVELLKIAYEYAYQLLGELYYVDSYAIRIREILQAAIDQKLDENGYSSIKVVPAPENINECIEKLQKKGQDHCILLSKNKDNQLIVIISLFCDSALTFVVVVSESANTYSINFKEQFIPIKKV